METSNRITRSEKIKKHLDDEEPFYSWTINKKSKLSKIKRVSGKYYYQKRFQKGNTLDNQG